MKTSIFLLIDLEHDLQNGGTDAETFTQWSSSVYFKSINLLKMFPSFMCSDAMASVGWGCVISKREYQ